LANELGVSILFDATIIPMMDGGLAPVALNIDDDAREEYYRDPAVMTSLESACAPPTSPGEELMNGHSCGAGFTGCYISPQGDVMPCVQFPLVCGSLRQSSFLDIWKSAPQFLEIRNIKNRDLDTCSSCSNLSSCARCPGLAFKEGNMRGPSIQNCQDTYAQTRVPTPLFPAPSGAAVRPSGQFVPLASLLQEPRDAGYNQPAGY
jgi:radical SAM protein with 4Fe4S-binding SPASM domain